MLDPSSPSKTALRCFSDIIFELITVKFSILNLGSEFPEPKGARVLILLKKMKISILLPYKENFSPNYAGSISLFVSQTVKKSKYLKCIKIFGSTDYKKILLNNYINIKLNSKFYESTSKRFIKKNKRKIQYSRKIEFK